MKNKSKLKLSLFIVFCILTFSLAYIFHFGSEPNPSSEKTTTSKDDKEIKKLFAKGVDQYREGKYKDAISTWQIVLKNAEETENQKLEILVSTNIGAGYNAIGYHKSALTYFLNTNKLLEQMSERNAPFYINYLNIGVCYMSLEQWDLAKKYLDNTKDVNDEVIMLKNFNLAKWHADKEDLKGFYSYKSKVDQRIDDLAYFKDEWNILQLGYMTDWKDTLNLTTLLTELADSYHNSPLPNKLAFNGAYFLLNQKLFEPIETILSYGKEVELSDNFYTTERYYTVLKDYYLKQNNLKQAVHYLELLMEKKELLSDEKNMLYVEDFKTAQVLKDLESKYTASQLNNKIIKSKLTQSKISFRFSLFLILIAIVFSALLIKSAKKSKLIFELKESESQNQLLIKELEKKELSENLKLSEEELNSSMVSIKKILLLKKQLYDLTKKDHDSKDDELVKQINLILNSFFDTYRDLNYRINKRVNVEKIISSLKGKFPTISEREFTVIEYILLQFTTKEIAILLDKSEKSIEYNRTQIRKKLDLGSEDSLEQYLSAMN